LPQPSVVGSTARFDIGDVDPDHPGWRAFGLTPAEIYSAMAMVTGTRTKSYSTMPWWVAKWKMPTLWRIRLGASVDGYAALAARLPHLALF
jgi:hypothetical protein